MREGDEAADLRRFDRIEFRFYQQPKKQLDRLTVILQRRRRKAALMPEGIEVLAG